MKLARLQHYRCGSYDSSTLVWVPDSMTENELDALVHTAIQDSLDAENSVAGLVAPKQTGYWDFINKADGAKTISQVKAEWQAEQDEYKAWAAKRDAARKSFAQWLKECSGGKIELFYDVECPLEVDVNWGHNHGKRVDYGATEISY